MYFDDIKVRMNVEIPPAIIEKEKMVSFALEYDNVPLHTDEEYAKPLELHFKSKEISEIVHYENF